MSILLECWSETVKTGVDSLWKIKGEKVFPGAMITSAEISAPIIFNEEKKQVRSLYCDTFLASNYQKYVLLGENFNKESWA